MEAATKNYQTDETIKAIFEKNFGKEKAEHIAAIKTLEGGYCNAVYEVVVENTAYILKIAPKKEITMMSIEKDLLVTEANVMQLLNEKTEIPMPVLLAYDDSCVICDSAYLVMSKIKGRLFTESYEALGSKKIDAIKYELGRHLKSMHDIKNNRFGFYPDSYEKFPTLREFVLDMFRKVLDDGIRNQVDLIHMSYDELWKRIDSDSNIFDEVTTPCLVHWDLWDGNVFVEGGKLSAIIDFERAMWGDKLMENEFSAFSLPNPHFLKGYGQTSFSENEQKRIRYYILYRMLIMLIEGSYRHYPDDSQYQWVAGEFAKWIGNIHYPQEN